MRNPPLPADTKVADRRHQDAAENRARAQARRPKKLLQTISNRGVGGNQVFSRPQFAHELRYCNYLKIIYFID
jgi:hypothetical protein